MASAELLYIPLLRCPAAGHNTVGIVLVINVVSVANILECVVRRGVTSNLPLLAVSEPKDHGQRARGGPAQMDGLPLKSLVVKICPIRPTRKFGINLQM
jgi:hypothetical protein